MSDITIATLRQTLVAAPDMAAAMRAYMVMNNLGVLVGMLMAPALFPSVGVPAGGGAMRAGDCADRGDRDALRHGGMRLAPA